MTEINTHGMKVDFGKHKGELYTRLPVSYLRWMVNCGHSRKEIAEAELKRRGTTVPEDLEVSGHAIDSASLRLRRTWHETRGKDEGLHSWLYRNASDAYKMGPDEEGRVFFRGIKFVFETGDYYPVLKTVMPTKEGKDEQDSKHSSNNADQEG